MPCWTHIVWNVMPKYGTEVLDVQWSWPTTTCEKSCTTMTQSFSNINHQIDGTHSSIVHSKTISKDSIYLDVAPSLGGLLPQFSSLIVNIHQESLWLLSTLIILTFLLHHYSEGKWSHCKQTSHTKTEAGKINNNKIRKKIKVKYWIIDHEETKNWFSIKSCVS